MFVTIIQTLYNDYIIFIFIIQSETTLYVDNKHYTINIFTVFSLYNKKNALPPAKFQWDFHKVKCYVVLIFIE